ncbi:ribonuclease P protein component [Dermabacter sp. p3-SID358]|uniref:ribonuclease P protein component n=1 Tax=Dermabacter sp. p3-SID358 TaxID=2916114 RepID=UPI0021A5AC14|nr:ribonuclease P protein component [Dermabacter sp. p3-SID358]
MRAPNRLRHNDDFRLTTRKGVSAARSHVIVHLAILSSPELKRTQKEPRVGFVVSKKVGNSVVRSRTKRRLREIMRARLDSLPEYASVVVRTRAGINEIDHDTLCGEVDSALTSALRKLDKSTAKKEGAGK